MKKFQDTRKFSSFYLQGFNEFLAIAKIEEEKIRM